MAWMYLSIMCVIVVFFSLYKLKIIHAGSTQYPAQQEFSCLSLRLCVRPGAIRGAAQASGNMEKVYY